jgi:phosphoglycerate dehydrogenase-like enzyme
VKWTTAISRKSVFEGAIRECAESAREALGPGPVTLALAFVTPHFAGAAGAARRRAIDEMAANAAAFLRGESRNRVV